MYIYDKRNQLYFNLMNVNLLFIGNKQKCRRINNRGRKRKEKNRKKKSKEKGIQ